MADGRQAETGPVQTNLQLWKDPNVIEGLKDILFDFDTHESVAEHAILAANVQWLKDHPNVRFKLAGYTDLAETSYITSSFRGDVRRQLSRS
jgi:outer membrane protein OmpA-like peptidoglycan-associated protein